MMLFGCFAASAQKQKKPNINKALDAWRQGNLTEAKQIIDDATTHEKTMNDGKTWYYRGLIYATLDTTSNDSFSSLANDALSVAMESFEKAEQLGKAGSEYFITAPGSVMPDTKTNQLTNLANHYLNIGINEFQDNQDYEASIEALDKSSTVFERGGLTDYPNDTLAYYVKALAAAEAEKPEVVEQSVSKLYESGAKGRDGYIILYRLYSTGATEDREKALKVAQTAREKFPMDPDFPKFEIGLLIDMGRISEARTGLMEAVAAEPDNKILHFYLGYANIRMSEAEREAADSLAMANMTKKDAQVTETIKAHEAKHAEFLQEARNNFKEALRVDPAYYEAQFYYATTYTMEVDKTTREYNATPSNAASAKKRQELIQKRVAQSEEATPHLEKALQLATTNEQKIDVLQMLSQLYYYTADDKNAQRVAAELKKLGFDDN